MVIQSLNGLSNQMRFPWTRPKDCLKSELALSIDNTVEIQGYTAWLEDAPGNQLTLRHVL